MNLNLLVALQALLGERSVTRAAARCHVSQPTMSYSLARLRELFDDPLLVRVGGALVPSPLAERVAARLDAGLRELQHVLETRDLFDPADSRRTFRVAASDVFQVVYLHRVLARIAASAPHVDLVVVAPSRNALDALASGALDLVAGSVEQRPGASAAELELARERFVCIVRADHPRVRRRLGLATYCELRHALVAADEEPALVDRLLARRGRARRVALRLPDFAGIGHVVASTDLVATVPERLARRLAEVLPLRVLAPPLALPDFGVHLYWHPRYDADPGARWLRQLLVDVARE